MYCQLVAIHVEADADRSPIVFVHGFPDSPEMFSDYVQPDERERDWLKGRSIYAIAFPNRHTNPNFPSLLELIQQNLKSEFETILSGLIEKSPTGKIIPIVHDLGATYTWRFVREKGEAGIERMVALSVGASFRYDIWEHGLFAFAWLYSLLYILPYYIPLPAFRRLLARMLVKYGGYQSASAEDVYKDVFHYWYAILWLVRFPVFLIPISHRTSFNFPVLFIRSGIDRIASTRQFESLVQSRPDCKVCIWEDVNHWFPEQHSTRVLDEIRVFLEH